MLETKSIREYKYHLDDKGEIIESFGTEESAKVDVENDTYRTNLGYDVKMHNWNLFSQNMYEYCYTIILYENECVDGYLADVRDLCRQHIMHDRSILERMMFNIGKGAVKD